MQHFNDEISCNQKHTTFFRNLPAATSHGMVLQRTNFHEIRVSFWRGRSGGMGRAGRVRVTVMTAMMRRLRPGIASPPLRHACPALPGGEIGLEYY